MFLNRLFVDGDEERCPHPLILEEGRLLGIHIQTDVGEGVARIDVRPSNPRYSGPPPPAVPVSPRRCRFRPPSRASTSVAGSGRTRMTSSSMTGTASFVVVGVVPDQRHALALPPLLELERSGADDAGGILPSAARVVRPGLRRHVLPRCAWAWCESTTGRRRGRSQTVPSKPSRTYHHR